MTSPRRRREKAFDFAGEVEGIGIGIYEFVGRVALTSRLTILCPRRFRLMYLQDLRAGENEQRRVAREIPYFLFAYALTIMLVFLIDHVFVKVVDGESGQGLRDEFPFLAAVSGKLLELDVIAWAFVIIPVLVGLHYGILVFDRIVRARNIRTRQKIYEPGSVMIYYVANNIMIPTIAAMLFILTMPMIDQHVSVSATTTLATWVAILIFLLVMLVVALAPVLLLLNSISFIRTMADIYSVGRLRFVFRALLASLPLAFIALSLFLMIQSIFHLLNAQAVTG